MEEAKGTESKKIFCPFHIVAKSALCPVLYFPYQDIRGDSVMADLEKEYTDRENINIQESGQADRQANEILNKQANQFESKPEFQLPRNIRQIGQMQEDYRIYVEDYVTTYLNQLAAGITDKSAAVLLLGQSYAKEDKIYYFVRGAICGETEYETMKDNFFTDEAKEYYDTIRAHFFPGMEVVGWAIVKGELGRLSEEYIGRYILQEETWKNHLFMEIDKYNCVDRFYICGAPMRRACSGYYVYYDRNDEMQSYLLHWNEQRGKTSEQEEPDRASRHFREVMEERRSVEPVRGVYTGLYSVSLLVLIMFSVIAINSINNYDKLKGLEATLTDVSDYVETQLTKAGSTINITDAAEPAGGADNIILLPGSGEMTPALEPTPELTPEPTVESGPEVTPEPTTESTPEAMQEQMPEPTAESTPEATLEQTPEPTTESTPESTPEPTPGSTSASDQPTAGNVIPETLYTTYIVQRGDTLMAISRNYYGNATMVDEICDLNGIEDGDSIYFGQKILLP